MTWISRARSGSTTGVVDLDLSDDSDDARASSQLLEDVSLDDVDEQLDTVQADLDALLSPPPTKTTMTTTSMGNGSASPGAASDANNPRSSTTSFAGDESDASRFSNVPLSAGSQGGGGSGSGFAGGFASGGGGGRSGVLRELKLNGGARTSSPPAQAHRAVPSNASLSSIARSPSPLNPSKPSPTLPSGVANKPQARLVSHKKSASLASLTSLASSRTLASHDLANDKGRNRMSSGNLPFLLQRLDLQKSQLIEEGKGKLEAVKSKEEQLKIQEELARMREKVDFKPSGAGVDIPVSTDLNDTRMLSGQENSTTEEQIDWSAPSISYTPSKYSC